MAPNDSPTRRACTFPTAIAAGPLGVPHPGQGTVGMVDPCRVLHLWASRWVQPTQFVSATWTTSIHATKRCARPPADHGQGSAWRRELS